MRRRSQAWDIDLIFDLAENLFASPAIRRPHVRARNVNTIDEVPDSSWFTNRILARPLSDEEAVRGPLVGAPPAPGKWAVVRPKQAGFAPGFTMRDAKGDLWFVSFDAKGFPEAATGAILVANKIFWALGYWQVENHLVTRPAGSARHRRVGAKCGRRRARIGRCGSATSKTFCGERTGAPDGTYRALRRALCPAAVSAGSDTTARDPTTRTTSSRTNTGASCAR